MTPTMTMTTRRMLDLVGVAMVNMSINLSRAHFYPMHNFIDCLLLGPEFRDWDEYIWFWSGVWFC